MTDDPTSPERSSFRRLTTPLLNHDPSLSPKATRWWIARARKYPAWLMEELAGLPDDQQNELRALVKETYHA